MCEFEHLKKTPDSSLHKIRAVEFNPMMQPVKSKTVFLVFNGPLHSGPFLEMPVFMPFLPSFLALQSSCSGIKSKEYYFVQSGGAVVDAVSLELSSRQLQLMAIDALLELARAGGRSEDAASLALQRVVEMGMRMDSEPFCLRESELSETRAVLLCLNN